MGVKFSQLPVAASVAADDYMAVLDTSENILKRTPIAHASTSAAYGLATTSNYGHAKIVDNLNQTSMASGEALSAHQGNVLATQVGTYEAGNAASVAHTKGSFFVWKGQFVKATAAIAAGTTISTSSNVEVTNVSSVLDTLNVTKAPMTATAGSHNSIFRGQSLGTSLSSAQAAAIAAGTFDDMFIGDYWTIANVVYRIAAFDYWLRCGDTECTKHHVVVVPDSNLYNAQMNDSNVTTGAYIGSAMYKTNIASARTTCTNAFGSGHILNHRQYFKNAVTNGYETAGAWYDSTVDLMNERMVYGNAVFNNCINGTNWPYNYTIDKGQLPLFALAPQFITNRGHWWLRDVTYSTPFALVTGNGHADNYYASHSFGVRPAFGVC